MPMRFSPLLATGARTMIPTLVVFSLYLLVVGHDQPGGGFAGGLARLPLRSFSSTWRTEIVVYVGRCRSIRRSSPARARRSPFAAGALGLVVDGALLSALTASLDAAAAR